MDPRLYTESSLFSSLSLSLFLSISYATSWENFVIRQDYNKLQHFLITSWDIMIGEEKLNRDVKISNDIRIVVYHRRMIQNLIHVRKHLVSIRGRNMQAMKSTNESHQNPQQGVTKEM